MSDVVTVGCPVRCMKLGQPFMELTVPQIYWNLRVEISLRLPFVSTIYRRDCLSLASNLTALLQTWCSWILPALDALLRDVRTSLRDSESRFVFTMTHPCFFKQLAHQDEDGQMYCKVTGYLQAQTRWIENFGGHRHYHRSLTYYFDCLRRNRLAVTRLFEPPQLAYTPEITDFRQKIPKFVLIEAMPY